MKINEDLLVGDTNKSFKTINQELENLTPVTLFNNAAGVRGNITLSDDISNYKYIEIIYSEYYTCGTMTKVISGEAEFGTMGFFLSDTLYLRYSTYQVSGKIMTKTASKLIFVYDAPGSRDSDGARIFSVIGYK